MLSFQDFFTDCVGLWTTERTYHSTLSGEVERSYTEYQVTPLTEPDKQQILQLSAENFSNLDRAPTELAASENLCPGFTIAFNTVSEKGERVTMNLKALFVPEAVAQKSVEKFLLPIAAQVAVHADSELIQGFYLRDQGYSEAGAIVGRFTYQPTRRTLEMTTFYNRSVAVDQMRLLSPDLRLRTIVTYQRPQAGEIPTVIDLIGFGVERKRRSEA
jgi:hypothetical protein